MLTEIICNGVKLAFNPAFVYVVEYDEAELQITIQFARSRENKVVDIDKRFFCLDNQSNAEKVYSLVKNLVNNPVSSVSLDLNALGFPVQIR